MVAFVDHVDAPNLVLTGPSFLTEALLDSQRPLIEGAIRVPRHHPTSCYSSRHFTEPKWLCSANMATGLSERTYADTSRPQCISEASLRLFLACRPSNVKCTLKLKRTTMLAGLIQESMANGPMAKLRYSPMESDDIREAISGH